MKKKGNIFVRIGVIINIFCAKKLQISKNFAIVKSMGKLYNLRRGIINGKFFIINFKDSSRSRWFCIGLLFRITDCGVIGIGI